MGTSVCGALITAGGTQLSVLGTLPCLALGVLFTVFRLRCAHAGECIGCGHCDSRCPFGVAQSKRMGIIADHFGL